MRCFQKSLRQVNIWVTVKLLKTFPDGLCVSSRREWKLLMTKTLFLNIPTCLHHDLSGGLTLGLVCSAVNVTTPTTPAGFQLALKKKTTIKVKASRLALKMLTGWMCCTQTRHQCLFWIFCGLFQRFVPEQTPTLGNQQITAAYNILISPTQLYQLSPFKTTVAETVSIREYKSNKIQLTITI